MRIGIISTRLAGTDGVSLEVEKIALVLRQLGHEVFYCAGELERDDVGMEIAEIHFRDPVAMSLGAWAFGGDEPDPMLEEAIFARAAELQEPLGRFLDDYAIDYVITQNILSLPMQLPLAPALAGLLEQRNLPGLAHGHDFYWERERFLVSRIPGLLRTYFPPALPRLRHAVINTLAQQELKARHGLESVIVPNVFDFETPAPGIDEFNADFREAIGLLPEDWLILQPTRVIPRKGIELAIELLARLEEPRAKLVITHHAGDEGLEYLHMLQAMAHERGVDLRHVAERIGDSRRIDQDGRKIYSLWDAYPHADLVTYPSLIEGFGNALLETIYFRKPALINRYAVYAQDIGPLGFQFVEIDEVVTGEAVAAVRGWLERPEEWGPAVERNFELGRRHYSLRALEGALVGVLISGG
jgi:glycosyltransferase involved in cell wall biosynthesis